MANLLTTAQVREHVETDLVDDALGRLNDAADLRVIQRGGPLANETDTFVVDSNDYPEGRDKSIFLERLPGAISSVSEQIFDNTPVVLAADDYYQVGTQLERRDDGTNPRSRWGHRVIVAYVPESDEAIRKQIIIDLIKLEVAYQGVAKEKAGDYSMEAPDYQAEQERILSQLAPEYTFA